MPEALLPPLEVCRSRPWLVVGGGFSPLYFVVLSVPKTQRSVCRFTPRPGRGLRFCGVTFTVKREKATDPLNPRVLYREAYAPTSPIAHALNPIPCSTSLVPRPLFHIPCPTSPDLHPLLHIPCSTSPFPHPLFHIPCSTSPVSHRLTSIPCSLSLFPVPCPLSHTLLLHSLPTCVAVPAKKKKMPNLRSINNWNPTSTPPFFLWDFP